MPQYPYVSHDNLALYDAKVKEALAGKPATNDTIAGVQINGVTVTPTNRIVNLNVVTEIPANYITESELAAFDYQDEDAVNGLIQAALASYVSLDFVVLPSVEDLPAIGVKGTFYLIPETGGETGDAYDEWVWANLGGGTYRWEKIGSTRIDLSGYVQRTDMVPMTTQQINDLWS